LLKAALHNFQTLPISSHNYTSTINKHRFCSWFRYDQTNNRQCPSSNSHICSLIAFHYHKKNNLSPKKKKLRLI